MPDQTVNDAPEYTLRFVEVNRDDFRSMWRAQLYRAARDLAGASKTLLGCMAVAALSRLLRHVDAGAERRARDEEG